MGIIQTLGSRTRVLTLLQLLGDEQSLRDLATRYRLAVPGFRPTQAPLTLIARTVARTCWGDPELQAGLERVLDRAGSREAASSATDITELMSRLGELPRAQVLQVFLRGLRDDRPEVLTRTLETIDAVGTGQLRLRADAPGARPGGPPGRRGEGRVAGASPGRSGNPRAGPDQGAQIATLRAESTQQEGKLQRLREQLDRERDAHHKTRKLLEAARREGAAASSESAPSAEIRKVRRELAEQERHLVDIRARHDTTLRDYRLVLEGCRLLENVVAELLASPAAPDAGATPLRPLRPARRSGLPPESKGPTPEPDGLWPAHFDTFLRRLAASEFVERLQPLGCASGRSTRINLEIPTATLLAQFSDGTRTARFLIVTSAHSAATLLWVRRHLIETCFPTP